MKFTQVIQNMLRICSVFILLLSLPALGLASDKKPTTAPAQACRSSSEARSSSGEARYRAQAKRHGSATSYRRDRYSPGNRRYGSRCREGWNGSGRCKGWNRSGRCKGWNRSGRREGRDRSRRCEGRYGSGRREGWNRNRRRERRDGSERCERRGIFAAQPGGGRREIAGCVAFGANEVRE
jgi:hypothetical protein